MAKTGKVLTQITQSLSNTEKKTARNNIDVPSVSAISDKYDSTRTYEEGNPCIYEGDLYVANTDIDNPEDFTPSHWTKLSITDILGEIEFFQFQGLGAGAGQNEDGIAKLEYEGKQFGSSVWIDDDNKGIYANKGIYHVDVQLYIVRGNRSDVMARYEFTWSGDQHRVLIDTSLFYDEYVNFSYDVQADHDNAYVGFDVSGLRGNGDYIRVQAVKVTRIGRPFIVKESKENLFASNGVWGDLTDIPATQNGSGYSLNLPTGGTTIIKGSPFYSNSGLSVELNPGTYIINATIYIAPYGGSLPSPSSAKVFYYYGGGGSVYQDTAELVDFSKNIGNSYSYKKTISLMRYVPNLSSAARTFYIAVGSTAHLLVQITDLTIARIG